MAYREASGAPEVELGRAVCVPHRGWIVAAFVVLAVAASTLRLGASAALVALVGALVLLFETLRRARVLVVRARGARVFVVEKALGRRERVHELEVVRRVALDERDARTWLALLPGRAMRETAIELTTDDEVARTSHVIATTALRSLAARIGAHLGLDAPETRIAPPRDPREREHARIALFVAGFMIGASLLTPELVALSDARRATEGRLALICTERCVLGGLTCLPGGTLEGSYAPGSYTIELAERAVEVPVIAGHRTTFECREDAGIPAPVPDR